MRRSVLLLLLMLCACGRFDAPPPKVTPPPEPPPPQTSTIAATLAIPMRDVLKQLDEKIKPQLAQIKGKRVKCPLGKCKLDLLATRDGPFTGSASGGAIHISLPFSVAAHLDFKSKLLKTGVDAHARGLASATSTVRLKPDWKLQSSSQGTVHLDHGDLRVGPIGFDLTDLWNQNEEHLSKPIFKALDRQLVSSLKIRPQAQRLWEKAFRPIKVGKKPEAWLLLSPKRIFVGPLRTANNAAIVTLAVEGVARVVVGGKPQMPAKPPRLPAPQFLQAPSNAFSFSVPATLSYADASKIVMDRLEKHPVRASGARLNFRAINFIPSHDDVVVRASFCLTQTWDLFGWFKSCGTGYLRGKPVYNAKARKISIVKLAYDVESAGLILKAIHALERDALRAELEKQLVFDAGPEIDKLHVQIRKALAKPPARGVQITGDVERFGDPHLTWTKDGFLASFTATGTVHADLNIQPPKPRKPRQKPAK